MMRSRFNLKHDLLVVFIVGVLIRTLCVFLIPKFPDVDTEYIWASIFSLGQQGYGYMRGIPGNGLFWKSWVMPLYSYVQAGIMMIVGVDPFLVRAVTISLFIVLGALSCVLVFLIAKRLGGSDGFSLAAAWIMALHPVQALWSTRLHPHSLFNFLFVVLLFLIFMDYPAKKALWSFFVGMVLGLLTLTRGEGAALFVPVVVWWLFQMPKRQACRRIALLLLAFFLVMSPWMIRNWNLHHRVMITATNASENVAFVYNPYYDPHDPFANAVSPATIYLDSLRGLHTETEAADLFMEKGLDFIRKNPLTAARILLFHLWHFWRPYLTSRWVPWTWNALYISLTLPILAFFFVGLWKARDPRTGWWLLGALAVWHGLIHMPFYIVIRFRENIFPCILLVAMFAIVRLWPGRFRRWGIEVRETDGRLAERG